MQLQKKNRSDTLTARRLRRARSAERRFAPLYFE